MQPEENNTTKSQENNSTKDKNTYVLVESYQVFSSKIVYDDILTLDLIHHYLRNELPSKLDISCVLIFKGLKHSNNGTFRDYAECKQPECNIQFQFNGKMVGLKTTINIYSTENIPNYTLPLSYQLRGIPSDKKFNNA